MRTLLVRVGLLLPALLCFIAPAWANSASYPAFGFGPTPSGGTFTFTPGIGNAAIVGNVPVMQIGASVSGFPLTTFVPVTGACGGGGCLSVQTGPETGLDPFGGFDFGSGGSITLTGTVGSFTGVIFHGSFSPCNPLPAESFCIFNGFLDQFGNLKINPAALSLLGISNASNFSHFISYFFLSDLTFQDGTYRASVSSGAGGGLATPEPGSIALVATGMLAIIKVARKAVFLSEKRR